MSPSTPTTAALRALARSDEERERVERIIAETQRAAREEVRAQADDLRRAVAGRRLAA
jgi:hypothetical protein